jgi:leucine dehydrogenase
VGYSRETALRMARGIYANLTRVFEISRSRSIPSHTAADRLAEERIAQVKALGAKHWVRSVRRRSAEV